jgi:XapX domain-containing protein
MTAGFVTADHVLAPAKTLVGDEQAMKRLIGIVLAFALGFACRAFGIPSPAPPMILGALLVMTMTIGYIAVDRWVMSPAKHAPDCGGPSGLTPFQTLQKGAGR